MRKLHLALALYVVGAICVLTSPAAAPKVVIVAKSKVATGRSFMIDASKSVADKPLIWSYKGPDVPIVYFSGDDGKGKCFAYCDDPVAGVYTFKVKAKGIPEGQTEIDADVDNWTVVVEDPPPPVPVIPPTPVVPVDPAPAPGPIPVPTPPAPISQVTDKLRVLFLYETSQPLGPGPYWALRSPEIRSYLNSHTMNDGKTRAWRMWDKDTVATSDTPGWQSALSTALAKLGPSAQSGPFTPVAFAFKDGELLDSTPVVDGTSTLQWLQKYGGR